MGAALALRLSQLPSFQSRKILVVETAPPPPLNDALAPSRPVRGLICPGPCGTLAIFVQAKKTASRCISLS